MAASSYAEAIRRLLAHEGGYSNHPADPGGPTKFGITLADYRRYMKPDAGAADMRAMPVEAAEAIYRAHYWNALACDRLPAGFDYALFDYGVHSGVARAARVACALVKCEPAGARLSEGCIAALNRAVPAELIRRLCDERLAFLKRLKTWSVFGRGWGRRVAEVRAAALAMAAQAEAPQPASAVPGKGAVPAPRAAQRGTAGAIAAVGATLAAQAQREGAAPAVLAAIAVTAAILAVAAWLYWRRKQRRAQLAVGLDGNA